MIRRIENVRGLRAVALAGAVALTGLAGCSAQVVDQSAPSVSPLPAAQPGNTYSRCPSSGVDALCVYGYNNVMMFTGPNQLAASSVYTLASSSDPQSKSNPYGWPQTWTGTAAGLPISCPRASGAEWCVFQNNAGESTTATYSPPSPLPEADSVVLTANQVGSEAGNNASCHGMSGKPANYTVCMPVWVENGGPSNFVFQLSNVPLIIQIENLLSKGAGNTPTLQGGAACTDPANPPSNPGDCLAINNMIVDTKGGWPTTIAPQTSGFFGAYLPASLAGMNPPTPPSISITYELPPQSSSPSGATVGMQLSFNSDGTVAQATTCNVQPSNYPASCGYIGLVGTPGGQQRAIFEITSG